MQHPGWVEAMNKELEALEKNNTWTLTELPSGHKGITFKWVYKTKFKPTNIIERLKARLVVRGFNQKEGLDYKHTFSPVFKFTTVKVLIAIATAKQWPLHQLDINNTFLHGYINEEIYMLPPEGYTKAKPGQVCKLNRSLYGLKQASRQWNQELTIFLVEKEDVLITGYTPTKVDSLKKSHDDKFTIKDLGLAKYFLGVLISDPAAYRRLVGRLLYLTMTRPNISYVVQHLSQIVFSPKDVYLQVAIHLLKYLKYTVFKGLFYPIQPHLQTKKQATLSRSSTKAEYRSMATTTCELLWLTFLLKDLHISVKLPITLFCNKKSAQQLAANPCFHDRSKHMDVDCHFTREKVQYGFLQTAFIPSHLQLADIMTKALNQV
uniref:Reverse transcriptase Ty1/copia-type domain-containing protein n=1 Tax=Tanacetum cinerariifolium TaxID=118510 RepID=A0A699HJE8_TANCI|nr:hypothetical protein [Tanacetum cinerariifolium]